MNHIIEEAICPYNENHKFTKYKLVDHMNRCKDAQKCKLIRYTCSIYQTFLLGEDKLLSHVEATGCGNCKKELERLNNQDKLKSMSSTNLTNQSVEAFKAISQKSEEDVMYLIGKKNKEKMIKRQDIGIDLEATINTKHDVSKVSLSRGELIENTMCNYFS